MVSHFGALSAFRADQGRHRTDFGHFPDLILYSQPTCPEVVERTRLDPLAGSADFLSLVDCKFWLSQSSLAGR